MLKALTIREKALPEGHPELANCRRVREMLEPCAKLQEKGIDFPNPFN